MEIIRKPGGLECLGTRGNMETPGRILRDLQRHRKGMRKKWKHMETQLERVDIARGGAKLNRHRSRDCQNKNTKCHND